MMPGPLLPDSKTRFTYRVADYVAGRPSYPHAVLDVLAQKVGFDRTWRVADIGAGTGISSRLFVENGNMTVAVEPNDAMREAAIEWLGASSLFSAVNGQAEATSLASHSVDLVVVAQAFHWFDQAPFATECLRLLSRRGYVLIMWNDRSAIDPFTIAYEQIVRRYAFDYEKVGHRKADNLDSTTAWFDPTTYHYAEVPNSQRIDADTARARIASSSYMPRRGTPGFDEMIADVDQLFAQYQQGGFVDMPHVTRMHIGRPIAKGTT